MRPPDTDALAKRLEGVIRNSADPVARQVCREAAAALTGARAEAMEEAAKIADKYRCGCCGMDGKAAAELRALAAGQGGENG